MPRLLVAVVSVALLIPALGADQAAAKKSRCRTVVRHGHRHRVCGLKKRKVAAPKPTPVTATLLDGSTLTTGKGTFGVTGPMTGSIPGRILPNLPSVATLRTAAFAAQAGAPCATPQLAPGSTGEVVLNADGTVFMALPLSLPDCGGAVTLLLAGKVGTGGLNDLVLETVPGDVTAHLVVKVDLGS